MRSFLILNICVLALSHKLNYRRMPEVMPADTQGKYIIKFKDSPSVVRASSFIKAQAAQVSPGTLASISSAQGVAANQVKYGVSSIYNSTFLNAMAVTLSEEDVGKLKRYYSDKIEYIEPDRKVYSFGMQKKAPWGLARVGQRTYDGGKDYRYPDAAGKGVDVYILDTGVVDTHPSFEGRAKFLKNFASGSTDGDADGHGTHVAGIVASSKYGVAKKANVYGVKVLDDEGNGSYSMQISGIEFVTARAKRGKTVINMSSGGPKSKIMEDAISAARDAGVLIVVAAGNESEDACKYSPADSPHALTVGATDQSDTIASFSNFGSCVNMFAPGVEIISLGKGGDDDTKVDDGTSMAAPHVVGVAAVYMSMKTYTSTDAIVSDLKHWASKSVKGITAGNSNALAFVNAKL